MMFKISSIWHDNKILKGIRNDGIPDPSSPSWTTQWSEATLGRVSALSWAAAIDTNKCAPACSQSSVVFLLISLYTTTEGHLLCHLLFIIMLIIFDKVYVKKAKFILVVYHYYDLGSRVSRMMEKLESNWLSPMKDFPWLVIVTLPNLGCVVRCGCDSWRGRYFHICHNHHEIWPIDCCPSMQNPRLCVLWGDT